MAMVVELLGAPGTGKSSLVRALDGRRVGGLEVMDARRLTRVPRSSLLPSFAGGGGRLLARDLTPAERRRALAAAVDARPGVWSPLLSAVDPRRMAEGMTGGGNDALHALYAPGWIAATLELRALADAAPTDRIVVLDEGLAQRARTVCGRGADDAALESYLSLLPADTVNLHLDPGADASVLVERLGGRARTIDRHAGLDGPALVRSLAEDVALAERTAGVLGHIGRDVHGVRVDGSRDATVAQVLGLLAQRTARGSAG